MELDLLDKKIMYELDLNARQSASQLARKLKRSKETVNFRIKRLIEKKYIKGFYTIFNSSKMGWFYYKVYIKFYNITPTKEKEIINYIGKQKNLAYFAEVEGNYDIIFLIMSKDFESIDNLLKKIMEKFGKYILEKELCLFLTANRHNQRFLYSGKKSSTWNSQVKLENYKLDETDKEIVKLISNDARISLIKIHEKTKLDINKIKYHIKKLEKDKIILAYTTSPNFDKLEVGFTQLNISLRDSSKRKEIINFFKSTKKCIFSSEMMGKYDLTIEVHSKSRVELKEILNEFKEKFTGIYINYDILTINKEHKMIWSPFE